MIKFVSKSVNHKMHFIRPIIKSDDNIAFSGDRMLEVSCDRFEIKDSSGKQRFTVTDKGLKYDIDEVKYTGNVIHLFS